MRKIGKKGRAAATRVLVSLPFSLCVALCSSRIAATESLRRLLAASLPVGTNATLTGATVEFNGSTVVRVNVIATVPDFSLTTGSIVLSVLVNVLDADVSGRGVRKGAR